MRGHNLICKTLKEIKPKELGSRKRIKIYLGVDLKGYFCMVMVITKKSRIVRKEAMELMELHKKIEIYHNSKIKKKYISIDAPICKYAKDMLREESWVVWVVK
jgi:hypothetical protein